MKCNKKCCIIKTSKYTFDKNIKYLNHGKKAGVFIYDPKKNKVLIIQSKGNLWGVPKGSKKYKETDIDCAIREVKEETGLNISESDFLKSLIIKNSSTYFYIEKDECDVDIQVNVDANDANDANSIGWINIDCLRDMINENKIVLTHHSKILFKKFINETF
jgi:8-oxo-dGTP pyrophosphatase MutT (NUDIX family)